MKRVLAVLLSAVLSLSVAVVPGIQTLAEEPDAETEILTDGTDTQTEILEDGEQYPDTRREG